MADPPKPSYPRTSWGPLAADPWREFIPLTGAWRDAVKHAWFRDGGTEETFRRTFPNLQCRFPDDPPEPETPTRPPNP